MLVLTRRSNQSIMIGDDIEISVLSTAGDNVRIGIRAPRSIPIFRREIYLEIEQERTTARTAAGAGTDREQAPRRPRKRSAASSRFQAAD